MKTNRPGKQRQRGLAIFLLTAFGLAWTMGFGFFVLGGELSSPSFVAMAMVYMFTPAGGAILANKIEDGKWFAGLGLQRPQWRWLLVAWLLPMALIVVALSLSLLNPGAHFAASLDDFYRSVSDKLSPDQLAKLHAKLNGSILSRPGFLLLISLVQVAIAGPTINAVAAFGEELGWRGFLVRHLSHLEFWRGSFLIGLIWGLWHLPLVVFGFNYPGRPVSGPVFMTLLTLLIAPIVGHIRLRAGSVMAAAVFHGTFNAAATLVVFIGNGHPLTAGLTGWPGFVTLFLADALLWRFGKPAATVGG